MGLLIEVMFANVSEGATELLGKVVSQESDTVMTLLGEKIHLHGSSVRSSLVNKSLVSHESPVNDRLACHTSGDTVMSLLFEADLDEALQLIFLCLDPGSLRAASLVSRCWHTFISRRLWGSTSARRRLRAKLVRRWREARAAVRSLFRSEREVYSMTCDQDRVYCGTVDGFLQVFCRLSGRRFCQ